MLKPRVFKIPISLFFSLTKIINPNVGIITNVSYAHIKNFKNLKGIANAKSEIINNIVKHGYIILNKDDSYYNFFRKKSLLKKLKVISFSIKKNSDIKLINIKKHKNYYFFYIKINIRSIIYHVRFAISFRYSYFCVNIIS